MTETELWAQAGYDEFRTVTWYDSVLDRRITVSGVLRYEVDGSASDHDAFYIVDSKGEDWYVVAFEVEEVY